MVTSKLENLILHSFEEFYSQRLKRLVGLKLKELLRGQNIHFLWILHRPDCRDMLGAILEAAIAVDDDRAFGYAFSQSLARIASETGVSEVDIACQAITMINDIGWEIPIYKDFIEEQAKTLNRFTHEFLINFCRPNGSIDLMKLVRYSSHNENEHWITIEMHLADVVYEYVEDNEDDKNEEDYEDDWEDEEDIYELAQIGMTIFI